MPGTAASEAAEAERRKQAAQYCSALKSHQFLECPLVSGDHYFRRQAAEQAKKGTSGEVMRKRLRWITQELGTLSTSLPLAEDSSVLLAVDEEHMDVLRCGPAS